ncbi:hypothetical protein Ahy_B06g083467 isoform A [Arachis hypogaea]|uniref:Uncharacterized protein n=1 Tax=Arachis hypogaea TaxID=3818 RepID=A0A444YQ18_ARAHY|nr:hypothetical protein Ahy_B06g083467 isoform A [Arachis hypogaea]
MPSQQPPPSSPASNCCFSSPTTPSPPLTTPRFPASLLAPATSSSAFVQRADPHNPPFFDGAFDFAFSARLDEALFPARFATEMDPRVRSGGSCVVAVASAGMISCGGRLAVVLISVHNTLMSSMSGESETVSFQASETQNTIQRILQSCSKLVEAGDIHESDSTISELVNFLDSLSDAALSDLNNEPAQNDAFDALTEIHQYICSPSLAQEAVDALSFELPKAVSKFAGISNRFLDKAISIIDQFLEKCGPRDMLSILCNKYQLDPLMLIGYHQIRATETSMSLPEPTNGLKITLMDQFDVFLNGEATRNMFLFRRQK